MTTASLSQRKQQRKLQVAAAHEFCSCCISVQMRFLFCCRSHAVFFQPLLQLRLSGIRCERRRYVAEVGLVASRMTMKAADSSFHLCRFRHKQKSRVQFSPSARRSCCRCANLLPPSNHNFCSAFPFAFVLLFRWRHSLIRSATRQKSCLNLRLSPLPLLAVASEAGISNKNCQNRLTGIFSFICSL
jgi:hypothetical protein